MRRPRDEWHQEVLKDKIIRNLDSAVDDCDEELEKLAVRLSDDPYPGETPEFIAKQIGNWITERSDEDFSTPVYQDTSGKEGERMALGYIGVKGFEIAEIGSVPVVEANEK